MLFFYITNLFIFYFILHGVKVNRWTLEATGLLEPRSSALEDDFEEEEEKEEEDQTVVGLGSLALDKVVIHKCCGFYFFFCGKILMLYKFGLLLNI